jgi:iron complex transport system ATP-binding protein
MVIDETMWDKGKNMNTAEKLSLKIVDESILEDVSVEIPLAKVTAILGPNGAGKSTLLKCLTGFRKVDTGKVNINGMSIDNYSLESLSRLRAVMSQSTSIDFPFTTLEVVKMGRNPYASESTPRQDDEIAYKALESVDGLSLKDRIFPTLSGGEQQRIQLARVVAQLWGEKNGYLFFDEPTSALDLKHQHQILTLICGLAREKNMAITIVLHDLNLALRYADRVFLMKSGRLFASGETHDVLTSKNIETVFEVSIDSIFHGKSYN